MGFIDPDLYLTVLDADQEDFKVSANEFLDRADAVILHKSATAPHWDAVSMDRLAGKPVLLIQPPPYVTPEIVEFVRQRMTSQGGAGLPACGEPAKRNRL
jgi:hypothetical protein